MALQEPAAQRDFDPADVGSGSKGDLADPSGISQLYPRNRTSRPFATDVGNGLRADVALFEILPSSFAIGKHLEP
jgi:hypothetical protein